MDARPLRSSPSAPMGTVRGRDRPTSVDVVPHGEAGGVVTERALSWLVAGLAAAVVLALLVTQAGPAQAGRDPDAGPLMHRLVDEARAVHGLPPLAAAPDMDEVAHAWSEHMAATREFEHNPDAGAQLCCWSVVAENIAWSDPPRVWQPGDPVARVTHELHLALLDSPGHRANILDAQVDQFGVGIHVDRDGSVWITQLFRRYREG
jgi:hypothetical protein